MVGFLTFEGLVCSWDSGIHMTDDDDDHDDGGVGFVTVISCYIAYMCGMIAGLFPPPFYLGNFRIWNRRFEVLCK